MKLLSTLEKSSQYQILILRVGVGVTMFFTWGLGKITAGPERWAQLGEAMATYGITFFPTFWGFAAAFAESIAALLIVFGLFTRINAFLLGFTFLTVIAAKHSADVVTFNFSEFSTPFYILLICVVLILTGGGTKLNLSKVLFGKDW